MKGTQVREVKINTTKYKRNQENKSKHYTTQGKVKHLIS